MHVDVKMFEIFSVGECCQSDCILHVFDQWWTCLRSAGKKASIIRILKKLKNEELRIKNAMLNFKLWFSQKPKKNLLDRKINIFFKTYLRRNFLFYLNFTYKLRLKKLFLSLSLGT